MASNEDKQLTIQERKILEVARRLAIAVESHRRNLADRDKVLEHAKRLHTEGNPIKSRREYARYKELCEKDNDNFEYLHSELIKACID